MNSEINTVWTCDYAPEEDRTDWPCNRDWNRCRNISSSLRIQQWIYCIWIIFGTQILCHRYQYPPEPPYIPAKFEMVMKLFLRALKIVFICKWSYRGHIYTYDYRFYLILSQTWHTIWTRLQILGKMIQWKVINLMDAKTQQDVHIKMLYRGNQGYRWLWLPILIHGSEEKMPMVLNKNENIQASTDQWLHVRWSFQSHWEKVEKYGSD